MHPPCHSNRILMPRPNIGLPQAYEAESHAQLVAMVEEQALLPKEVFTSLLNKIYKRQK